jgi:hypothetical protein
VFSNILQILRNGELEGQIGADIGRMVTLARESVIEAGKFFWGQPLTVEDRLKLHGKAEAISDIEHIIRNLMLVHLPLATSTDSSTSCARSNVWANGPRIWSTLPAGAATRCRATDW